MATWITHLMIADQVMKKAKELDRRGFCVGNIAPDCNVENEDWTSFTPSREITHWMSGEGKAVTDGDSFYEEYIIKHYFNYRLFFSLVLKLLMYSIIVPVCI